MELEDIDEDFEYAGECVVCGTLLDMSEVGFCKDCEQPFCWSNCGGWGPSGHRCDNCGGDNDDD
jgi:hypothetical protein